jgi:hypothetical protein
MLQFARNKIIEIVKVQGVKPLGHNEATWLKILVNSFYLNLRGAIDNLAWFLNYIYNLQEIINEDSSTSRSFTSLFGDTFLEKLKLKDKKLADRLKTYKKWQSELKLFRDPAAHRIPLMFAQSIINEEGLSKSNEINKELQDLCKNPTTLEIDRIGYLLESWQNLGRFEPIIITTEVAKSDIKSAPNQFDKDYELILDIGELIVTQVAII